MFAATSKKSDEDLERGLAEEVSFEESVKVADMNSPASQMQRDYQLIKSAIESPGKNQFSGEILKKIYALLFVGNFYYSKNNAWHKWDTAPIVAALCHGSRVIIQLDNTVDDNEFLDWLFPGREHDEVYRHAATHGLKIIKEKNSIGKKIAEEKISITTAGWKAVINSLYARISPSKKLTPKHYGINLAVGGDGSQHPITRNLVSNNGKHGHLYLHHRPSTNKNEPPAWLVGIEQSAPGHPDQQGGSHSLLATRSKLSATDGTYFGEGRWKEEKGVPDFYYDSLFLLVTNTTIDLAKSWSQTTDLEWLNYPHLTPQAKTLLEKPKEKKPRNDKDKREKEGISMNCTSSDEGNGSLCLIEEKKDESIVELTELPLKQLTPVSNEKRIPSPEPDIRVRPNDSPIISPPEFKLSTDPAQKAALDHAALIFFGVGMISSCIIIGTIWYTGSAFVIGFSLMNAAWLVPVIAIVSGAYYCYQSMQFSEMLVIEKALAENLKKPEWQHLQKLATTIHNLTISPTIKKQLYNEFQNEIKDKKNLKAEEICQKLIDAENKKHFPYCKLFSRRSNQQAITALEEYKKSLSP